MAPTERTIARRYPDRVTYDRATAYAILDEALAARVGFTTDTGPVVIPTLHAFGTATRIDDPADRVADLEHIVDTIVPGRLTGPYPSRPPSLKDGVQAWAGRIPLPLTVGTPIADSHTGTRFPAPDYTTRAAEDQHAEIISAHRTH
ncbi:hypothetical protein VMT65_11535 [Nocardia sp. CDC153]|uniref:hypothetical protein n=1 Tax=Nocardia sp. CDC153 TaxID=3112167 RepID=UPI002DBEC772|nr:hypothetical protein [Nocardia sp. CDC153]MEC3953666.1 hypothetical protein [Nocardia sp. CDC153]